MHSQIQSNFWLWTLDSGLSNSIEMARKVARAWGRRFDVRRGHPLRFWPGHPLVSSQQSVART
ncbi:hypothetical protein SAMN05421753_101505 [Planctomicrobium piriforme]|uniref:Uncharacterized protein n=1 Tax=Planctomicrobium piriforme TaxID=1576369 RepID=A0A1I3BLZ0_9PLAN|nr:hypothetical protein SAMN05421753_101505 [Planctomicrobium piriforme]